jgi:hypothetical protein
MGRRGRKAEKELQAALPPQAPANPPSSIDPDPPIADWSGASADAALARRCAAGDVAAWDELYQLCHPPLLLSIEMMLGSGKRDRSLVEEIAARVWYALVENDGELLDRFDPSRGVRLATFMRALARDEIGRHYRTEKRRREREYTALHDRPRHTDPAHCDTDTSLSEFMATLTPHERGFAGEYLLNRSAETDSDAEPTPSPSNFWQLTRRIRRKLLDFLDRTF